MLGIPAYRRSDEYSNDLAMVLVSNLLIFRKHWHGYNIIVWMDEVEARLLFMTYHLDIMTIPSSRLAVDTAGGNLIPHVLKAQVGEDIVGKLLSVVHMGSQAVCILSAAGSVAITDIRPPVYLGSGVLRCEIYHFCSGFYLVNCKYMEFWVFLLYQLPYRVM